jgi:carbamoyl-phosphate synthase large subunit
MLKPIKVLVTACGCPGASTLLRMLRDNGERSLTLVGVDMDPEAIGRFIVDRFYQVPPAAQEPAYVERMLEIVKDERPDVLFPESSFEVPVLAKHRARFESEGTRVVVSSAESIALANNKYEMYEALRRETSLMLPAYAWPHSLDEFVHFAEQMGYPGRPLCFKPHVAKGSRGFRIMDPSVSRRDLLMNYKPNSRYMSLEEFVTIFKKEPDFPDFLLMEFLRGGEATTDSLCLQGEELLTTVKTVEQARWGVIVRGELVRRPDLVEQTREILRAIPLSYCVNLQFIGDRLIEINPRVSTFIYQDDLIPPYLAVKLSLGEISTDEVRAQSGRIAYGRRMVRYMDQVFHSGPQQAAGSPGSAGQA